MLTTAVGGRCVASQSQNSPVVSVRDYSMVHVAIVIILVGIILVAMWIMTKGLSGP